MHYHFRNVRDGFALLADGRGGRGGRLHLSRRPQSSPFPIHCLTHGKRENDERHDSNETLEALAPQFGYSDSEQTENGRTEHADTGNDRFRVEHGTFRTTWTRELTTNESEIVRPRQIKLVGAMRTFHSACRRL